MWDNNKVEIRTLPITPAPTPPGGGRIMTPSGELAQVINGQTFRFLAYLEFIPGMAKPRGNHYHTNKTESLYIIGGKLRAVFKDLDTGDTVSRHLSAGDLITIKPGCAHVYFAEEYSQAIEISDTAYNPDDTTAYIIQE